MAGGGTSGDVAYGLAVSGPSVYVTGAFSNTSANGSNAQLGGVALAGASLPGGAYVVRVGEQALRLTVE